MSTIRIVFKIVCSFSVTFIHFEYVFQTEKNINVIEISILQIPEYCKSLEENEIAENAFSLIFAFDEIVALGYRESVNLSQIRTFVEMDSHEEKVYQAVRQVKLLLPQSVMLVHVHVLDLNLIILRNVKEETLRFFQNYLSSVYLTKGFIR